MRLVPECERLFGNRLRVSKDEIWMETNGFQRCVLYLRDGTVDDGGVEWPMLLLMNACYVAMKRRKP